MIFVSFLPLFGGLAFLGAAAYIWRTGRSTENWVPITVTITESTIRKEYDDGIDMHYPIVRYTYTHEGKRYSADGLRSGGASGDSRLAKVEALISQYPVSDTVTAYMNPDNPEEALLIRGVNRPLLLILVIMGVPFTIGGLVLLVIFA